MPSIVREGHLPTSHRSTINVCSLVKFRSSDATIEIKNTSKNVAGVSADILMIELRGNVD